MPEVAMLQREVAEAMVPVVGVGVLRFAGYSSPEPKEGGGDFGRFLLDELLRKRSQRGVEKVRIDTGMRVDGVSGSGMVYLAEKGRKTVADSSFSGEQPWRPGGVILMGRRGETRRRAWRIY